MPIKDRPTWPQRYMISRVLGDAGQLTRSALDGHPLFELADEFELPFALRAGSGTVS
jgi:hypothetical protein